jgi:hypothetical protein
MEDDTVTISRKEYESLKEDAALLAHLEANGVNNWEGYSHPSWDDEDDDDDY